MKRKKNGMDGISRREFIKVAGVAAGAAGMLAQPRLAMAAEGTASAGKARKHPRSVTPADASKTRRELQEFIDDIALIDTHEHLAPEPFAMAIPQGRLDFSLLVSHYVQNDLDAVGMPKADKKSVLSADVPVERKWQLFEPYWEKMKNTGYGWAVELAASGYYGLEGLNSRTYVELSKRIREEYKPGLHQRVLNAAGIERAIVDVNTDSVDRTLFSPVLRVCDYITISKPADMDRFTKLMDADVTTAKAVTEAMQRLISDWKQRDIAAAKCAVAYRRTLQVDHVSENDAQRSLDILLTRKDASAVKPLQDFVFHKILQACSDHKLPIQIHTGILAGTNYGPIERTNPMHLCDALARYPQAKVSLFHAGYPWVREVATMGKTYTAAYADLCWTHIISPIAAKMAIHEWLDAMPASKILAFGGDYMVAECAYSHAVIARTNVGEALTERVESGRMSMAEAKQVAEMILRDNALEVFQLA